MDAQELKQLVRNSYPFPIAYTHKKTLGVLDDNIEKLKCLVETAEAAIQFLALLALAQVRQDLLNPPLTPPRRGIVPHVSSLAKDVPHVSSLAKDVPQTSPLASPIPDLSSLREEIKLANPTFGKWNRMAREAMKAYCDARDHLIVPELFDVFWFWDTSRQKLRSQRLDNKVIGPLIILRNDFHHGRVPDGKVQERVAEGLHWLHQLLEAIQFLAQYQLSFTQRITLKKTYYIHDLMLFSGCVSDRYRWESEMALEPDSVVFLHSKEGRHLVLNPFIIVTDQINGVPDLLLLNNVVRNKAVYVSSQFGEVLETAKKDWAEGRRHHEALSEFLDRLVVSHAAQRSDVPVEEAEIEDEEKRHSAPLRDSLQTESPLSTTEVFQQKYQQPTPPVQHTSPYKFLDYYNPEDHDIFFGRDKEIRLLQQRFYNSHLLVLHGESGTGKTSLIRAGLIPRLDPESYVPVYVRMLQDPLNEIKRELIRQLGVEDVHPGCPQVTGCDSPLEGGQGGVRHSATLRDLLQTITEHVSKTVVIVLDQFEEFFLRFPEDVREQFKKEFAACVETPRLDVKFLISLRVDYFSYLAQFEDAIPQIFTHQLQLEHLTEAQALEAVIKPPEQLGIQVDEAMVQIKLLPELVSEEGIEPPLLQIVCDALYQNAQSEGRQEIGIADYEAIGDVRGCLGRYLESKLRQFGAKQPIARAVLKALVTAEGTKRASFVEELLYRIKSMSPGSAPGSAGVSPAPTQPGSTHGNAGVSPTLAQLGSAGVLPASDSPPGRGRGGSPGSADILSATVAGETPALPGETLKTDYLDKFVRDRLVRVEEVEGRARYELSHDYLVKHIEAWIEESEREITKVLELIDRAYEAYQTTDLLLENSALQMIKPHEEQLVLPPEKQAFLNRSKIQLRKQRRGLFLKVAVLLLSVALVVGGVLGYQTYQAYQESEKQRKIAISRQEEAEISAIEALNQTSKTLFFSHDELNALLASVKAGKKLKQINVSTTLKFQTIASLQGVVYGIHEKNRLEMHKSSVSSITLSPNGNLLASGGGDGTIKLWNIVDGQEINTLYGHTDLVYSVAFSPDGTLLASGSRDKTIKFWKVVDGHEIRTLHGHTGWVNSVTFSPDGTLLASGGGEEVYFPVGEGKPPEKFGEIKFWNVADGREISTLRGHSSVVNSLAFNPDGTFLASGSWDNTIKLWKVADGSEIRTFFGHVSVVRSVAFSPDGTLLASGSGDNTIKLWKVVDGSEVRTFFGHTSGGVDVTSGIVSVVFSPDGTLLASGGVDNTIKLWNVADGLEIRTLQGHSGLINSLTFSPDGMLLASGSEDKTVKLWEVASGSEFTTLHEDVGVLVFNPDGTLLVSGNSVGTIRLWKVADGSQIRTFFGHSSGLLSVIFSPDGTLLASGSGDSGYFRGDNTIKLWNVVDDQEIKTLHGHSGYMNNLKLSPDGTLLASGGEDGIKLWNVATGKEITTLSWHSGYVSSLTFSPDGTLLVSAGGEDNTIKLWNVADGQEIRTLHGHPGYINSLMFSPDGMLLASGGGDSIKLWNVATGKEITTLSGHSGHVYSLTFSPDGTLLASGGNIAITLWNLDLDDLLVRGCEWLQGYLKTSPYVSDEDRSLCEEILRHEPQEKKLARQAQKEFNNWMNWGKIYVYRGHYEQALEAYRKAREIKPEHEEVWLKIGNVYQKMSQYDQAIEAYRKVVELKPDDEETWSIMGDISTKQGKLDEAIFAYQKQIKILEAQGKWDMWDMISKVYLKLLAIKPDYDELALSNKDAWDNLGVALAQQGKLDEALMAFQKQVEVKPDHEWAWGHLGYLLAQQGKLDEAIAAYQKQVDVKPDHEWAWGNLGNALAQQGKLDEAIVAYWKQIEIKPNNEWTWNYWGNTLRGQGKLDEAIATLQKHAEMKPNDEGAWNNLGNALLQQDRLDEALAAFQKQVEVKPDHEWAWGNIGRVLAQQGNLDGAVTAYRKQIAIKPDHENVWHKLGEVLWSQGKWNEALTAFQKHFKVDSFHEDAWNTLGNALARQDKLDEAIAAFRKQVEVKPEHEWAWGNMGDALFRQIKLDEAIVAYRHQVNVKPDHENAWNSMGKAFYFQDKLEEAISAYQKQVEVTPNHSEAWGNLGDALARQGKSDEAITAYRKQVEVKPDHEWAWNALGSTLEEQSKRDEAIVAYRKQVEVKPDYELAWKNLGSALWKQGQWNQARNAWDKLATIYANTLKTSPDSPYFLVHLGQDAELALIQGDISRCRARIATAMPLVRPDSYYFAILPFYTWLADPSQGWENVLAAITELKLMPEAKYAWDFSYILPALDRLDEQTRQIAQDFIAFFEGKIDLPTLKARLAEKEENTDWTIQAD